MNTPTHTQKYTVAALFLALVGTTLVAIPALADTTITTGIGTNVTTNGTGVNAAVGGSFDHRGPGMAGMNGANGTMGNRMGIRPVVFGKVTAINGTSLSVDGRQGFGSTSATVSYAVNASAATVFKDNATSSLSAITVGDMIAIGGTVSGTTVTATTIHDGLMMRGGMRGGMHEGSSTGQMEQSPITGNGQPVIAGTVTAINGSSVTITNKSNVVYTVDTSSAKIVHGKNTITMSDIHTNDDLVVQGAINGTSVSASSVIDQTTTAGVTTTAGKGGFFGAIGNFFKSIFGF